MRTVLILALVLCYVHGALRSNVKRCTNCPANTSPCDQIINTVKDNCTCSNCITRCSVRYNRCAVGEECIEVPSNISEKVFVAKCVPFTGCHELSCPPCPISGYFVDKNNCQTCLCNDPCAELKCPKQCIMWSTSGFLELNVECGDY